MSKKWFLVKKCQIARQTRQHQSKITAKNSDRFNHIRTPNAAAKTTCKMIGMGQEEGTFVGQPQI